MSYEYLATKAERAAEALLREKGWSVSEPTCPLCHGWGGIARIESGGSGVGSWSSYSSDPCPNECPAPAAFYYNLTSSQPTAYGNTGSPPAVTTSGRGGYDS